MQSNTPHPPNEIVNTNFQVLLDKFHTFLNKNASNKEFIELKQEAISKILTDHQRSAILARCNNVINGTYGSTSRSPEKSMKKE